MDKYVTRKEVLKILGIHYHTLYSMARRKEIETLEVGKRTLYNLDKYLRMRGAINNNNGKLNICYCRVSSNKQKGDLERQINQMKELYPNYKMKYDHTIDLFFCGSITLC
jgi:putative resolvase